MAPNTQNFAFLTRHVVNRLVLREFPALSQSETGRAAASLSLREAPADVHHILNAPWYSFLINAVCKRTKLAVQCRGGVIEDALLDDIHGVVSIDDLIVAPNHRSVTGCLPGRIPCSGDCRDRAASEWRRRPTVRTVQRLGEHDGAMPRALVRSPGADDDVLRSGVDRHSYTFKLAAICACSITASGENSYCFDQAARWPSACWNPTDVGRERNRAGCHGDFQPRVAVGVDRDGAVAGDQAGGQAGQRAAFAAQVGEESALSSAAASRIAQGFDQAAQGDQRDRARDTPRHRREPRPAGAGSCVWPTWSASPAM